MSDIVQILGNATIFLNLVLAYTAERKNETASVAYHMGFALILGVILF